MDSLERRSRGLGAVITTYHLRAPGSSHHQVVSHSIVQRFTDEATAHILYTHTHTDSSTHSHLNAHTHTHAHTEASCQLLTRQIGSVVYSMAPVHIPTGPSPFIWKWLDEGKQHVTVTGLSLSKLVLFCIFSTFSFYPSLDEVLALRHPIISGVCSLFPGLFHRSDHQRQHQLFPHVQADIPSPSCHDGHQSCCSSWPRRLGSTVRRALPECFTAHVSYIQAHIITQELIRFPT